MSYDKRSRIVTENFKEQKNFLSIFFWTCYNEERAQILWHALSLFKKI